MKNVARNSLDRSAQKTAGLPLCLKPAVSLTYDIDLIKLLPGSHLRIFHSPQITFHREFSACRNLSFATSRDLTTLPCSHLFFQSALQPLLVLTSDLNPANPSPANNLKIFHSPQVNAALQKRTATPMNAAASKARYNEGWKNSAPPGTLVAHTMSSSGRIDSDSALTREQILRALEALSDKLRDQHVIGELCLFGGTVMVIAYNARLSTKDVDAIFQPSAAIRAAASAIADEQNLAAHWLNDGVKCFVSARHNLTTADLPQFSNLRLTMPVPEYLLAMKCMAARVAGYSGEASDIPDILFLIKHLHLNSADDVLRIVAEYYPANQIPVKTQFLVESVFQEGRV